MQSLCREHFAFNSLHLLHVTSYALYIRCTVARAHPGSILLLQRGLGILQRGKGVMVLSEKEGR